MAAENGRFKAVVNNQLEASLQSFLPIKREAFSPIIPTEKMIRKFENLLTL